MTWAKNRVKERIISKKIFLIRKISFQLCLFLSSKIQNKLKFISGKVALTTLFIAILGFTDVRIFWTLRRAKINKNRTCDHLNMEIIWKRKKENPCSYFFLQDEHTEGNNGNTWLSLSKRRSVFYSSQRDKRISLGLCKALQSPFLY